MDSPRGTPTRPPISPSMGAGGKLPRGSVSAANHAAAMAAAASLHSRSSAAGAEYEDDDYEVDSSQEDDGENNNGGSPPVNTKRLSVQFINTGAFMSGPNSAAGSINDVNAVRQKAYSPSGGSVLGDGTAPTRAASPDQIVESYTAVTKTKTQTSANDNPLNNNDSNKIVTNAKAGDKSANPETYLAVEEELRRTAEYKVAWDLELWRMVQRQRIEKELKDYRKKLQDEARSTLFVQEREIKKELEKAISELAAKEKVFEEEERRQDKRKTKLLEAERELERRSGQLVEQRKRLEEEAEQRIRRFKAEFEHKEELSQQRLQTLQDTVKRTEARLEASQREYLKLWEEFAEFRTRTLTNAPSESIALERLRTQHGNELVLLQERLERSSREQLGEVTRKLEAASAELSKVNGALSQKREQLRQSNKEKAAFAARVASLEEHVSRLVSSGSQAAGVAQQAASMAAAATSATVTSAAAGCSNEISALRHQLEGSLRREKLFLDSSRDRRTPSGIVSSPVRGLIRVAEDNAGGNILLSPSYSPPSATETALVEQLSRWRNERKRLLEMSGGAYDEGSPVITTLDANIQRATDRLEAIRRAR